MTNSFQTLIQIYAKLVIEGIKSLEDIPDEVRDEVAARVRKYKITRMIISNNNYF